jgi:hypothetical protein
MFNQRSTQAAINCETKLTSVLERLVDDVNDGTSEYLMRSEHAARLVRR